MYTRKFKEVPKTKKKVPIKYVSGAKNPGAREAEIIRNRKFGIDAGNVPRFTNLSKLDTEPPLWFLNVNGQRVELDTEQLQNQYKFQS